MPYPPPGDLPNSGIELRSPAVQANSLSSEPPGILYHLSTLLVACKLVQSLLKTMWMFLKKLKMELPHDPAILLLSVYQKKTKTLKDTCTPKFILYNS